MAYTMAENVGENIISIRNQFSEVHKKVKKFSTDVFEIDVSYKLECTRARKRKRLSADESTDDVEALDSSLKSIEIETYIATVDVASGEIDRRFSKNRDLYQDIAMLEPRRFGDTNIML